MKKLILLSILINAQIIIANDIKYFINDKDIEALKKVISGHDSMKNPENLVLLSKIKASKKMLDKKSNEPVLNTEKKISIFLDGVETLIGSGLLFYGAYNGYNSIKDVSKNINYIKHWTPDEDVIKSKEMSVKFRILSLLLLSAGEVSIFGILPSAIGYAFIKNGVNDFKNILVKYKETLNKNKHLKQLSNKLETILSTSK